MTMIYGVPSEVMMVDSERGGFRLFVTDYQISYSNDNFPRISFAGVMGDPLRSKESKQHMLRQFTIIDLMDEVGRRIRTGENKKEAGRAKE